MEYKRWIKFFWLIAVFNMNGCHEIQKPQKESESNIVFSMMFKDIEFESQGALLRGRLYLPQKTSKKQAVVIMAHGFTTTINGMTADRYAEKFCEEGMAVLLYDHINLGISEGEPRQEINFWVQTRGYIDAIDFVENLPELGVRNKVVWGASLSAREAFLVGTIDSRVDAVIAMIPAFGEEIPKIDHDGSSYDFAKNTLLLDNIKSLPHSTSDKMPIVSSDQLGTPSALTNLTAYNWFIEYGGRFGTKWKNLVSFTRINAPENLHIGQFAHRLKAPILMIVAMNDEMNGANPKVSKHVFDNIVQPKKWVDIDGGHFGLLYYPSNLFAKSSKAQIDFLNEFLNE